MQRRPGGFLPMLNYIIAMPALSKWFIKLEPGTGMRIGVWMAIS